MAAANIKQLIACHILDALHFRNLECFGQGGGNDNLLLITQPVKVTCKAGRQTGRIRDLNLSPTCIRGGQRGKPCPTNRFLEGGSRARGQGSMCNGYNRKC